jgi:LysR family transcriptional regulator, cyn operon transcriptional activator
VDQRRLVYFVTLAEHLHFRRAAERLHITQPALSHHVKSLEEEMGVTLFDRVGHKVQLTDSGRIYREHALRALKEMEHARTAIKELGGLLRGNLAIGVFQSFNSHLLPPILVEFHERYPGIRVIVRQLPKKEMEEALINGELDIGIAYSPTLTDNVEAEVLFDEPCVLIVGRRHALHGVQSLQLSALEKYPLVLVTPEFPLRQLLDYSFAKLHLKPNIIMELNATEAILEIVTHSTLATILSARRPRSTRGVHCVDLNPAITRRAAIFWRRGSHRTHAATAIGELIKKAYLQIPADPRDVHARAR